MSAGLLWILAGIMVCGVELLQPGVFLLWIGLAAIGSGGVVLAGNLSLSWQVATFLMCLAVSLSVPVVWRRRLPHYDGGINAPDSNLLGRTCHALSFEGSEGRVSFRDGTWPARTSAGPTPAPGTVLRIVGLEGTTLLVVAKGAVDPPPSWRSDAI